MKYEIEKNIPVPRTGSKAATPELAVLRELATREIGSSVFLPGMEMLRVMGRIANVRRKNKDVVFTCRKMDGGIRVWRVA